MTARALSHTEQVRVPADYDATPERYRLGMRQSRDLSASDLYERIAELLVRDGRRLVLDVGCGEGPLRTALPADRRLIGVDVSRVMLENHPAPVVQADATALPFASGSVDAVVAVNMLYHLEDPAVALGEAQRVVADDGLFVAATISRDDSPELAEVWRPPRTTFDAEEAPALVGSVFGNVEVEPWDAPLVTLTSPETVRDYLVVRFVDPDTAARAARLVRTPLSVTKRGALVRARKTPRGRR